MLALTDSTRQVAVLRSALKVLLSDGEVSPQPHPSRSRTAAPPNVELLLSWPELRDRLRAEMVNSKIATAEVAAVVGITRPHLTRVLCASGQSPGPQVRAALQAWLEGHQVRGNGAADPHTEPETIAKEDDPCRLTIAQRDRLAAVLQLDARSYAQQGLASIWSNVQ